MSRDLRRQSRAITEGPSRAPALAMLKAVGFNDEDLRRALVGAELRQMMPFLDPVTVRPGE